MDSLNPIFAIGIMALATATGWAIYHVFGIDQGGQRVSTLDGLRGYLALAVACHHSAIWYQFLHNPRGGWVTTPSPFYNELGESGVALFFMITGFLFFNKILDADTRKIDWHRLYASRILRLSPLYFFVVCLVLLVVGIETGFVRHESVLRLLHEVALWACFSIQSPNINTYPITALIVAGATWTLQWEWKFYLVLPLIAWAARTQKRRQMVLTLCVALIVWFALYEKLPRLFLGGMAAAALSRQPVFVQFARSTYATLLAIVCLLVVMIFYIEANRFVPFVLLSVFFAIVANGNALFGILTTPAARLLGEVSYSIYLIHGLVLFVLVNYVLTHEVAASLSPIQHWGAVTIAVPVLVGLSFLTFSVIEAPAMRHVDSLTAWLRRGSAALRATSGYGRVAGGWERCLERVGL